MDEQRHELVFEKTHSSGAEERYCPTCGRRMLMSWEPRFKKIVLEVGDEYALHSGSRGGLQVESVQVRAMDVLAMEDESQPLAEKFRLTPWIQWLEDADFDNLWGDGS